MDIKNTLKTIPEKPGCYIYYDEHKKIIYVGKAKNLKRRVSSYFNRAHNFKTTQLVRSIDSVETIVTTNERESLLLEQNLIKKYRPRYNIVLNDDKSYPYIVITNEKDPQYLYVRKWNKKYKRVYGPLPDGSNARKILHMLERLYPLRRCKGHLGKPCLYYHIEQCLGACFKDVPKEEYDAQIKRVDDFFKGRNHNAIESLREKMNVASENLQFEEAQRIKEVLEHVSFVQQKQNVDLNDKVDVDIFNYAIQDNKICLTVLFYNFGKLSVVDHVISEYDNQDIEDLLSSYINQIYQKNRKPKHIIIPDVVQPDDLDLEGLVKINAYKGKKQLLELAYDNAISFLEKDNIKSSLVKDDISETLKDLQTALKLPRYPQHIEMFDVANIYEEYVTGGMVVFKNGYPSFNDFRKFHIDIEEQDDYHRMQNMIYRRYQKDLAHPENLPDLIIMDGGIIQVHAAKTQLDLLGLDIPIIGLVKDDHHKTDHILGINEEEIYIEKKSPVFNLLTRIQDRVHNFAITSFRKRQNSSLTKDPLNDIKGLGKVKITQIHAAFPTQSQLIKATYDKLYLIIKNEKVTRELMKYLKTLK